VEIDEQRTKQYVREAIRNSTIITMKRRQLLESVTGARHVIDKASQKLGIPFSWSQLNAFSTNINKSDIAKSINMYGVLKPIIVDKGFTTVVDGFSRLDVLSMLVTDDDLPVKVQILPFSCDESNEAMAACVVLMYLSSINKLVLTVNPLRSIICDVDPSLCAIEARIPEYKYSVADQLIQKVDELSRVLGLDKDELLRLTNQFIDRLRERRVRKIDARVILGVAALYLLNQQCRATNKNIRLISITLGISRLQKRYEKHIREMGIEMVTSRCGQLAQQVGCPQCSNAISPVELVNCAIEKCGPEVLKSLKKMMDMTDSEIEKEVSKSLKT